MAFTDLLKDSYVEILDLDRSLFFYNLGSATRWSLIE
jgi:hypothetical protein